MRQHFSDVLVELLPRIEAAFACVDTRGPQHVCFYQFYQAIVNMLVVFRELKRAAGALSSDLQRIQAKCLHAIGCVAGDMADMVSRHEGTNAYCSDISTIGAVGGGPPPKNHPHIPDTRVGALVDHCSTEVFVKLGVRVRAERAWQIPEIELERAVGRESANRDRVNKGVRKTGCWMASFAQMPPRPCRVFCEAAKLALPSMLGLLGLTKAEKPEPLFSRLSAPLNSRHIVPPSRNSWAHDTQLQAASFVHSASHPAKLSAASGKSCFRVAPAQYTPACVQ